MPKATTGAQVLEREPTKEEMIAEWKRSMDEGIDPFIVIPNGWDTPEDARRKAGNEMIWEAKKIRAQADAEKNAIEKQRLIDKADVLATTGRKMGGVTSREIDQELARNIVANERILDARMAWLDAQKKGDEAGKKQAGQDAREARKMGGTIPNCDTEEMKRMVGNQMILSAKILWAEAHKEHDPANKEKAEKLAAKGRAMGGTIILQDDLADAQRMVANEMIWGAKQIWADPKQANGDANQAVASAAYAREHMGGTITIDHSIEEAERVVADNRSHTPSKYGNSKGRAWNGVFNKAEWENHAQFFYDTNRKPGGDKWANDNLFLAELILYGSPKEAEWAKNNINKITKSSGGKGGEAPGNITWNGGYEKFLELLAHHESRGYEDPYKAINQYGFVGKYQMGELALIDAGFYKRDGTKSNDFIGSWTSAAEQYGVKSLEDFLNSPEAQEAAIREYHKKLWNYIEGYSDNIGSTMKGVKITASGMLAGAHLVGLGGIQDFFTTDSIPEDGNRTKITVYISDMGGLDLTGLLGSNPDGNASSDESNQSSSEQNSQSSEQSNRPSGGAYLWQGEGDPYVGAQATNEEKRAALKSFAIYYNGKIPYNFKGVGTTPDPWDLKKTNGALPDYLACDQFMKFVYINVLNKKLSTLARNQVNDGETVWQYSSKDTFPNWNNILIGDLIFIDWNNDEIIDHVAMHIGDGQIVHTNGGDENPSGAEYYVNIKSYNTSWYKSNKVIKRIVRIVS